MAAGRVLEPAAIESRMPNSIPPYMPINAPGIIVSNRPSNGARTKAMTKWSAVPAAIPTIIARTMSIPGATMTRTTSVVATPIRMPAR